MGLTSYKVPAAEAFVRWMDEQAFTAPTLAAALGCSRSTVWKWSVGRTTMDSVSWIACQHVAGGAADVRRRRKALEAVVLADQDALKAMRGTGTARRAAEATAARR